MLTSTENAYVIEVYRDDPTSAEECTITEAYVMITGSIFFRQVAKR